VNGKEVKDEGQHGVGRGSMYVEDLVDPRSCTVDKEDASVEQSIRDRRYGLFLGVYRYPGARVDYDRLLKVKTRSTA